MASDLNKRPDKHVLRTSLLYGAATAGFWILGVRWLLNQMAIYSPLDPYIMHRWLVERSIRVIFCDTALLGLLCFMQWWDNGNAWKQMLQDGRNIAYVLSALILGNVLLLIGG